MDQMNSTTAADIVQRLIRAAEAFAQFDPHRAQSRQSWSVWWRQVPAAARLFQGAVEEVVLANELQLSLSDTAQALTYGTDPALSLLALGVSVDKAALDAALQEKVLELANDRTVRRLQYIMANLFVDAEVPRFFGVELVAPTTEELQGLYDDPLIGNPSTNAVCFANVNVPGDSTTAFLQGVRQVERFLNLIQGCGSGLVNFLPIYIVDRNPFRERTIVREWSGGRFHTTLRIGYGHSMGRTARVHQDLLSLLQLAHVERLVQATTRSTGTSDMLAAVVASLETLGESCKPNLEPTRMLLVSSALEMLVGGRDSDRVTFRGQTAAVAERATFLVGGKTLSDRVAFDRRVRALYAKGSKVRHGGRPDISIDEVVELASIARRVALTLLERPELENRKKLDDWVQQMRYTTDAGPPAAQ